MSDKKIVCYPIHSPEDTYREISKLVLYLDNQACSHQVRLHQTVQDLKNLILSNAAVRSLAESMVREATCSSKEHADILAPIRHTEHLLELINAVINIAPLWDDTHGEDSLIGFPLNLLLSRLMSTPSGWTFFTRSDVNEKFRHILNSWTRFLETEESTNVLSCANGWCRPKNLCVLATAAGAHVSELMAFKDIYVCPDPRNEATLGFASWDAFFLRQFQPDVRPLAASLAHVERREQPSIDPRLCLVSPCECSPVRLSSNVKLEDRFWLKHQPYSMTDMLDKHWSAPRFEHGIVYQAFLSALKYHRWHAPVSGRVIAIHNIPGTYFSQLPMYAGLETETTPSSLPGLSNSSCSSPIDTSDRESLASTEDFEEVCYDDSAPPNLSQPYLTAVATRTLILIDADCAAIGLVGFLAIGMAEVSSCQATVHAGQHVEAGDEIGMFHYGGSSCCLLLEPAAAANLEWQCDPMADRGKTYPLRSLLACIRS